MAKFCGNCGHELLENADVCLSCGKRLETQKPNVPKKDDSLKIVLIVVGAVILIPILIFLFAFVVAFMSYDTEIENVPTSRQICCEEAGGTWKNNICTSGGNYWYDSDDYYSCVYSDYDF